MKNQNNTEQSVGKQSFLKRKNVEISFKRYAIDAMGAMALGLFASLLIGTIIKTLAENVGTTGLMAALSSVTDTGELAAKVAELSTGNHFCWILWQIGNYATMVTGAATVGCCCNMLGFAVISYPDNGVGGLVAQGLGTSMLQVPNLMRKPILWIPPVLTSAILGPVSTCIFQLRNNGAAISSGMGTAGLVGPIGIITGWSNMPEGYAVGAFDWLGMILVCFVLPVLLSWAIGKFMRKKGWIKEGDLKVDLG